ncbi:antitoxin MazE family protein [Thiomicrospira microaerophila]|uniref:antitoxin MazE family protein n=1 Tax=Thiomicrospira microaerophila TaxID=406020 RepID=UPI0005C90C85|nr:antitoxin MazE family protein [Thiomicrospira microaerophila]
MATSVAVRVQNYRDQLRAAGYRPVQIWVKDTRTEDFVRECQRQMRIVAAADQADGELQDFMNDALDDASAWQ